MDPEPIVSLTAFIGPLRQRQGSSSRSSPVCDLSGLTLGNFKAVTGRSHRGHCPAHSSPGARLCFLVPWRGHSPGLRRQNWGHWQPRPMISAQRPPGRPALFCLWFALGHGAKCHFPFGFFRFCNSQSTCPGVRQKLIYQISKALRGFQGKGKCRECFARGSECEQETTSREAHPAYLRPT